MNPATIDLVIGLLQLAIKETPGLIAEFQTLFSTPEPTPEDWQALRDRLKNATYASLVPNSDLPTAPLAGTVTALAPAPAPAIVPTVTDQAQSEPATVADPGLVTPVPSPAPGSQPPVVTPDPEQAAAPLTAAMVFANATMRK